MMLGLPADDVERIAHAALLHDVGKLAMPAELLGKEGPLTHDEWEVMSEHPIVGERILARTKELAGDRPDRPPRARALGRHRLPGRARAPADPDRLARDPRLPRLRRDDDRAPVPRGARRSTTPSPSCAPAPARSSTPRSIDALLDLLGHNAAAGPRPRGGREARRAAAARAYVPAVSAGVGHRARDSVAE